MLYPNSLCIVTGGSSGIGKELSLLLYKKGYRVLILDLKKPCFLTKDKRIQFAKVNLSKPATTALVNTIFDTFGLVNLLINNAGIGTQAEIVKTDRNVISNIMQVNYFTPLELNRIIANRWIQHKMHGHIVNVSSGQVFFKLPTWGVYSASKSALASASETLHYELKRDNIWVTTVYPFMVNTGFYDEIKKQEQSLGSRLVMRLLPYYSYSPKHVAKQIIRAVDMHKKVEMCSFMNTLAQYIPLNSVRRISARVLR